jgi:hypothetical protein
VGELIMAKEYYQLFVVMCEDRGDHGTNPEVSAIFESKRKADAFILQANTEQSQFRYYLDASFTNVFED